MCVENGVVISGFQKDYELQSWNEQGEINSIEGMLTISFCHISPCFHKDKKKLYLIIKIRYLVDMSTDLYVEGEKKPVIKKAIPVLTPELYDKQVERIKELPLKIEKLESEIKNLKKDNLRLKIKSGETRGGWTKEHECIYRRDPETGLIMDSYRCPRSFRLNLVKNLSIFYNQEKCEDWCKFEHRTPGYKKEEPCSMPLSAYEFLKMNPLKQNENKIKKTKKLDFKSRDDIISHLDDYSLDSNKDITRLKYLEEAINFLWNLKDVNERNKRFRTKDFRNKMDYCSPATIDSYLDTFVDSKIILRTGHGSFKVNF